MRGETTQKRTRADGDARWWKRRAEPRGRHWTNRLRRFRRIHTRCRRSQPDRSRCSRHPAPPVGIRPPVGLSSRTRPGAQPRSSIERRGRPSVRRLRPQHRRARRSPPAQDRGRPEIPRSNHHGPRRRLQIHSTAAETVAGIGTELHAARAAAGGAAAALGHALQSRRRCHAGRGRRSRGSAAAHRSLPRMLRTGDQQHRRHGGEIPE